jgi:hypothetical protein
MSAEMKFVAGTLRIAAPSVPATRAYNKWHGYGNYVVVILYPAGHPCSPYETDGWHNSSHDAWDEIRARAPSNVCAYTVGVFNPD